MAHPVAPQREAETDVGRQDFPAARFEDLAVELVRLVAGPAVSCALDHGRRQDAGAVKLATASQHFREAVHVSRSGHGADPGHLCELLLERAVGPEITVA